MSNGPDRPEGDWDSAGRQPDGTGADRVDSPAGSAEPPAAEPLAAPGDRDGPRPEFAEAPEPGDAPAAAAAPSSESGLPEWPGSAEWSDPAATETTAEPAGGEEPAAEPAATPPVAAIAPEPGEPSAATESAVEAEVERLAADLGEVTSRAEAAERRADEVTAILRRQSELLDELRSENHRLRDGEIREAMAPLIRGLARLSDDLGRIRTAEEEPTPDIVFLDSRVSELLHDCGVLPERPTPGDSFDPRSHQATGSAPTESETAHMTIAEMRRAGLRRDDGRILRPADVVVFRYRAPVVPAMTASAPEDSRAAASANSDSTEDAKGESG